MIFDITYLAHALIIWAGSIREIVHIYRVRQAKDVTLFWVCALLAAEVLALPRAISSGYWVWWVCHIVGAILMAVLLIGVVKYGRKVN